MRGPSLNKFYMAFGPRPLRNWLFLLLVSILVVIALLGSSSSSSHEPVSTSARLDIYTNYRRSKEQAASDYLELRSLSLGDTREFNLCGRERENFVPCYNVTANSLVGFKDGDEFDRHCEVSGEPRRCLVRTPKDYKTPMRWPIGKDVIWSGNVKISKDQFLSSGTMTKRLMLLEENQIAFHSEDGLIYDGVKDYSHQIAEMIGLESDSEFVQAGVHNVLDIGCGFGSFGAHLLSVKLMAVCIAPYEVTGSQVQLVLERGLPAMIGNFISRQLPYPSLSYAMVHCAQCGVLWDKKDGLFLFEVDRVLIPGGYFVLTSPATQLHGNSLSSKRGSMVNPIEEFTKKLCWNLLAQQDETFIWQKTVDPSCHASSKHNAVPLCPESWDAQSYYKPLARCISGTTSKRWISVQNRSSGSLLNAADLKVHGVEANEFSEDFEHWRSLLGNYWSLLTPLIFSDHPKRPGDEDPLPPYNMIRNVMDMNAHYGGFNAALVEAKKSVWVMNVVPLETRNLLPLILDQGFAGVLHDWCEPFPTYTRTYDLLHANGLLSHLMVQECSFLNLFLEMDRILRPEGWVIVGDKLELIDNARAIATRMRWEARIIDLQNGSNQKLLVCQKQFLRK